MRPLVPRQWPSFRVESGASWYQVEEQNNMTSSEARLFLG